jgi:hypothetical protein
MRGVNVSWQNVASLLGVCVALGCRSTGARAHVVPNVCDSQATDLEQWLRNVKTDGVVPWQSVVRKDDPNRYTSRPLPRVELLAVDEPAAPLPMLGMFTLANATLRFGDDTAQIADDSGVKRIFDAANASALMPGFGSGGHGGSFFAKPAVVFLDRKETWSSVSIFAGNAAQAGITDLYFVFAVRANASAPRDTPVARSMVQTAQDSVDPPWKIEETRASVLAASQSSCPAIGKLVTRKFSSGTEIEKAREDFILHVTEVVRSCNCNVDVDALRAFAWIGYGRHWGSPTTSHALKIAASPKPGTNREPIEVLALPGSMRWEDAYLEVIKASKQNDRRFILSTR